MMSAPAVVATSYINKAMSDPACQEILRKETDVKVEEFEKKAAEEAKRFAAASVLETQLSCLERLVLLTGTTLLVISAYALLFASSYCFEDFNLHAKKLPPLF